MYIYIYMYLNMYIYIYIWVLWRSKSISETPEQRLRGDRADLLQEWRRHRAGTSKERSQRTAALPLAAKPSCFVGSYCKAPLYIHILYYIIVLCIYIYMYISF